MTEPSISLLEYGQVKPMRRIIREVAETILEANDGDRERTAKELGIAVRTLYNWQSTWRREDSRKARAELFNPFERK